MKSLIPTPQKLSRRVMSEGQARLGEAAGRSDLRVFPVQDPLTVFVRATQCRVAVRFHPLDQVEIHARFYNAFGLRFVAEQDDAGVYIVVKRRRLVGWIASAEFLLYVPPYANLALHLTQGHLHLQDVNGMVRLPPITPTNPNEQFYAGPLGAKIVLK